MPLERLLEVWEKLGPYERKVLLTLANRIYSGQRLHGLLEPGKKKWVYESYEERLDDAVYSAMQVVEEAERIKAESDESYNNPHHGP